MRVARAVCSKGYSLADDGSSCVDNTAVAIGKGIYNNPLVQQAGNATQARGCAFYLFGYCTGKHVALGMQHAPRRVGLVFHHEA